MRLLHPLLAASAPLVLAAALLVGSPAGAATTVTVVSLANIDATIAGSTVENFEDVTLIPGLTITLGTWRNASNVITANGPVIYSGTLPHIWNPAGDGFANNAWDGPNALVNGWTHDWLYPFASSVRFDFVPPVSSVGIGCSNFQSDATAHELKVNDASQGNLEALTGWIDSIIQGRNGYLYISAGGEAIHSIEFVNLTHYDGLVFDKLAAGPSATPTHSNSWGRVKSLYR